MAIGYTTTEFLTEKKKRKINMRRLIKRAHNIKDLYCLENIDLELTFSDFDGDEKEE